MSACTCGRRALLAVLLMNAGRVVSTDQLTDALWGDEVPDSAGNALQVYVSSLRKALAMDAVRGRGKDVLQTLKPGYLLKVDPEQVDASRFQHVATEGARALQARRITAAAQTLRQALAPWRGPAFADFTYEAFARTEIERLDDLRVAVLEDRIEADLALGQHGRLIPELQSGNNESGGKHHPGSTRKGSKWLRAALVESAKAAARSRGTYFSAQYARLKGRRGPAKATIAVAHSLLVVAYYVLSRDEPYQSRQHIAHSDSSVRIGRRPSVTGQAVPTRNGPPSSSSSARTRALPR